MKSSFSYNQIIKFDKKSGALLFKSSNHWPLYSYPADGWILEAAMSDDGQYFVVGASEKVFFYNRNISRALWVYNTGGWVRSVDITRDGQYIVAGCWNSKIILFNRSGSIIWEYNTSATVEGVRFSKDSYYIVAGSRDNNVYFFNRTTNSTPNWIFNVGTQVQSVAISEYGNYIAVGSYQPEWRVHLLDSFSPIELWNFTTGGAMCSIEMSDDGQFIASGSWNEVSSVNNKFYLFNKSQSYPVWTHTTGKWAYEVAMDADGLYFAAGGGDCYLYLFNRTSNVSQWSFNTKSFVTAVAISENSSYVIGGNSNGVIYCFNRSSSKLLWTCQANDYIDALAISSDNQYILAASSDIGDGRVEIYHINKIGPEPLEIIFMKLSLLYALSQNSGTPNPILILVIISIIIGLILITFVYLSRKSRSREQFDETDYFEHRPTEIYSETTSRLINSHKIICPNCEVENFETVRKCTNCGTKFIQCNICKRSIGKEEIVYCSFCNTPYHKSEFLEWLKVNASCKVCKREMDMWEFQRYLEELENGQIDISKKCNNCHKSIPKDANFCIYCGVKTN